MSDLFAERVYGVPWLVLAAAAAVIAFVYLFIPVAGNATGPHWFVLRWFHTIAWIFLGLAAIVRAKISDAPVEWVAPLAGAGGLVYVVFMIVTVAGQAGS